MRPHSLSALTAMVNRHAPLVFGALIVLLLWAGVFYKDLADRSGARRFTEQTEQAYAIMFEENVLRAIGEIDKTLLYVRRLLESHDPSEVYRSLATTKDLLSDIIVQVAILDNHGIMRATNVGPQPPQPKDLSDRAHFKAHQTDPDDFLYIGQPLIGRASDRMSVQFSRRFSGADGGFGGVVVASLDPYHFAGFLDKMNIGSRAAITLIGDDGVVRADSGPDDGIGLGASISKTPIYPILRTGRDGTFEIKGEGGHGDRFVTLRKVDGQPLWVMVSESADKVYHDAERSSVVDSAVALLLTLLIVSVAEKLRRMAAQRREAEIEVGRLARHDPLTGLPNRRMFTAKLDEVVESVRRPTGGEHCAVFLLDLDSFKSINDTLGHGTGDALLVETSRRLAGVLEPDFLLARLGGDEFAVVVPRIASRRDASALADLMARAAAEPIDIEENRVVASISIGIAIGPKDGDTAKDLLIAADLSLYAAKSGARGGYMHFEPAMKDRLTDRRRLEQDLRAAIQNRDLSLHYQPTISLTTGRIVGFEALARWRHPSRGDIPPSVFIGTAEETGLIVGLGRWALEEACSAVATWPQDIRVSVNLSPLQLADPDLVEFVASTLSRASVDARRLEIEITEQTLLDDSPHNRRVLGDLKALGLTIAMDDFGTGYSSLNYLQEFPFDRVKVDRSFVSKLGRDPRQTALVRAVMEIAREFGMATTAEGVETTEQRDALAALGCNDAQGYLFAKALPGPDVLGFLNRWCAGDTLAA